MVIQHNLSAMNAHRQTGINNRFVNNNLEKLSSGFKINRAADDAAGLAISEKMRGQIRGTMMGTQNVNMGINLVQTAESGLNEIHSILQRMRELAVQSSNGTYQDIDRAQIDKEYQALKSEVDRIAESTHYNGIDLLNIPRTGADPGATGKIKSARDLIQASFRTVTATGGTNDQIRDMNIEFGGLSSSSSLSDLQDLAARLLDIVELGNDAFVDVINTVNDLIADFGDDAFDATLLSNYRAQRNGHYDDKVHYEGSFYGPVITGTAAALAATDSATAHAALIPAFTAAWGGGGGIVACHEPVADAAWELLKDIKVGSDGTANQEASLWIQCGANCGDGLYVERCDARSPALGIEKTALDPIELANEAIAFVDKATNIVSSYRADFGASQNRLESIVRNNDIKAENLQDAESTIRDVDMAKEMMEFTKNNILAQASQSMLAQANQMPQNVLQMLKAA